MKSIKPGRGPSGMSFIGSIIAIVFGLFWTAIAFSMTRNFPFGIIGIIFPLFGVIFVILGIIQAAYHYKNATGKDRFSLFDITERHEEGDPSEKWIKDKAEKTQYNYNSDNTRQQDTKEYEINFCPFCGSKLQDKFFYCPKCGERLK